MKQYTYQLDELVKTWKSTHFKISAKNKKEADKMAKKIAENKEFPEDNWINYEVGWDDNVPDADSLLLDEKGNTIAEI